MFDDRQVRSSDDSQLNAITSDLDDFEELVHIHRPCILRYALAALRDKDLAETGTPGLFP